MFLISCVLTYMESTYGYDEVFMYSLQRLVLECLRDGFGLFAFDVQYDMRAQRLSFTYVMIRSPCASEVA